MSLIRLFDFGELGDERGQLVAVEGAKAIPFEIKRVYYLISTKMHVSRGFHAHKDLQQVAICIAGKGRMVLDDGKSRQKYWLDSPSTGILIDKMIGREMHDFSNACFGKRALR